MTSLLIMGPPGAGKGTQAAIIAERLGIPAISTGDIFRANIAEQTELGRQAQTYLDNGDYVPDELTNDLVRDRLGQSDCAAGFLLDGYPRTGDQVRTLDAILESVGSQLDAVLVLATDTDEVVRRLARRAAEQGRSDDGEDTQRHRLEVYEQQTAPLLKLYADRGLLHEVDGTGEVAEVTMRILATLGVDVGADADS